MGEGMEQQIGTTGSGVLTLRLQGKNPFLIPQDPESWGRWQGAVNSPRKQRPEVVKELSDGRCTTRKSSVHGMEGDACATLRSANVLHPVPVTH